MNQTSTEISLRQNKLSATVMLIALFILSLTPAIVSAAPDAITSVSQIPAMGSSNPLAEASGLFSEIFKVAGSLAVVLGLLMVLVWWVRKMGISKGVSHQGDIINILDTRMIAPKKFVTVLEVGGECVVVGVTETSINLLTRIENNKELTDKLKSRKAPTSPALPFAKSLSKALHNFNKKEQGKEI